MAWRASVAWYRAGCRPWRQRQDAARRHRTQQVARVVPRGEATAVEDGVPAARRAAAKAQLREAVSGVARCHGIDPRAVAQRVASVAEVVVRRCSGEEARPDSGHAMVAKGHPLVPQGRRAAPL
eukprot:3076218-Prymnesium_polylepis.2